ncbi:alpha-ketoacid dehydrogenase subunit beta [Alkalicoccus urumqiensis]|uniref:Alpha-ketoacid dehydrogenase subunit beta n=1 Tax=Alkalicoccus urumqiensis TaxID=1548213 RepID=A0A2P6ME27_ALKUR|nr:alpha-ketoacid dehydrogenase subunit beta [Alkalicoccus urumqiensis]PRO64525.1 alpha-ketoacid dehydrogenase subunit beta [Alkalicoccus urumqiensis]
MSTRNITMLQAVNEAMHERMEMDSDTLLLGEDIGKNGGVFRATDGLYETFGPSRVIDTPLAEAGIIGSSIGLALNGKKPIVEIQFLAFIYPGFEQLVSHAARMRYRTRGQFHLPMVIRAPYGAGIRGPELHSESVESFFVQTPGLKVVAPGNPYDAKGLFHAAVKDPDPVLFLEDTKLYRAFKQDVPAESYEIPLGKAAVVREGSDLTMVAWGSMVREAVKAAERMEKEKGWSCEVIDLRTIYPFDRETIIESVKKTGRAAVMHEAHKTGGLGAEITAVINEEALVYLRAPVQRVAGYDVPVPQFMVEDLYLPDAGRMANAVEKAMTF